LTTRKAPTEKSHHAQHSNRSKHFHSSGGSTYLPVCARRRRAASA
jgi:hypothetical protein